LLAVLHDVIVSMPCSVRCVVWMDRCTSLTRGYDIDMY